MSNQERNFNSTVVRTSLLTGIICLFFMPYNFDLIYLSVLCFFIVYIWKAMNIKDLNR